MASLHLGDVAALVLEHAAHQSQSLVHGLQLLHVLPECEQPGTRAAALARGFVDPALAVALGHTQLLSYSPKWLLLDARIKVLKALAAAGDVDTLSAFFAKYCGPIGHGPMANDGLYPSTVVQAVLSSGHIRVLEWLDATSTQQYWSFSWLGEWWADAARAGHVHALEWAFRNGKLDLASSTQALQAAAGVGQLGVIKWLHARRQRQGGDGAHSGYDINAVLQAATRGCHLAVLDWLWIRVVVDSALPAVNEMKGIVDTALSTGNLDMVRWWWAKFETYRTPDHRFGSRMAAIQVLNSCSLPAVEWLWAKATAPSSLVDLGPDCWKAGPRVYSAPEQWFGALPVLQWWVKTQLPAGAPLHWQPRYSVRCAEAGAVDVLDWVLALPDQSCVKWGDLLAQTALEHRQQRVLDWWGEHRAILPVQQPPQGVFGTSEGTNRGLEVIDWWETHVGFEDPLFLRLGPAMSRHCDHDWVAWWCAQLAKPARKHLAREGLKNALLQASSVWALDLLKQAAAAPERGVTVTDLAAGHTCIFKKAVTIEAVCWWYVVLGGADSDEWQSWTSGGCRQCGKLTKSLFGLHGCALNSVRVLEF